MSDRFAALPIIIAVSVLAWNILLAGWIASRRQAPRFFTSLSGFCGLLVAPAVVVAVATGTDAGARTVIGIAWLWPLITTCFAIQVAYAIARRLVSPVIGVPLLLYDLAIAAIAFGDYSVARSGTAADWLQAAVAARDSIVGFAAGRASLVSPLSVLVPMIAPAFPARWKASAAVRALLTLSATVVTTLLFMEWPRGYGAIRSYDAAASLRLQERPQSDFRIGLRLFPTLDGPPSARAVRADLALAEQLQADVVLVVLREDGTRPAALDSLARVLEPMRADSVIIAIALELGRTPPLASSAARISAFERVLTRVRPDVLFPAVLPAVPPLLPGSNPDAAWWRSVLVRVGHVIERVRPRTMLGWAASREDATDSVVYAWATSATSPVDIVGAVSFPSFAGLPGVDARLRAIDRWRALAVSHGGGQQRHWLFSVGGFPHAHGDDAQTAAIMHALAWGTRRPWVTAALLGEPGDYDGALGLRAANGRVRPAVNEVSRAARGLRETTALGR